MPKQTKQNKYNLHYIANSLAKLNDIHRIQIYIYGLNGVTVTYDSNDDNEFRGN